jgi:glycosyltransferase involved in cell wall biosynthesis
MILGKSLYAFGKGVALAQALRGRSLQHLHAHWATMPTTAALVISRLLDIPFSFTAHAWDIYKEPAMLPEKMRAAQFVVTISHYNRNYLQSVCPDLPPDRIQVVRCGIDLERFSFSPPVSTSPPLILSVARSVEKKGLHWLVEACTLLMRDQNVPFRCEIVGRGRFDLL